jgi:hypothetical protein
MKSTGHIFLPIFLAIATTHLTYALPENHKVFVIPPITAFTTGDATTPTPAPKPSPKTSEEQAPENPGNNNIASNNDSNTDNDGNANDDNSDKHNDEVTPLVTEKIIEPAPFIPKPEPIIESIVEEKNSGKRFVLMIMLYNEKNEKRIKEYLYCLEQNMAHPLVSTIHIFYDTSDDFKKERKKNVIYNHLLKQQKIYPDMIIEPVNGRVSYDFCFKRANKLYQDCTIILSNADIYYNKTLDLLKDYDLENLFLSITRHDVYKDGSANLPYMYTSQRPRLVPKIHPITAFHDTWIFKSPIVQFKDSSILMGTAYCDWRIVYEAHAAGMTVINPCLSIRCYHVHMSAIRNYDAHAVPRPHSNKIYETPWCILPAQRSIIDS